MSRIIELSNFVFTRNITDSHGFLSSFFSCPELSNYRISITRNITDSHGFFFFCPEFSFFLSRIIEFSNFVFTRNIADGHGVSFLSRIFFFLVPNYRIIEFQSHGISRTVTGFFLVTNYRIIEFYLSCPETCPLSRIIEFLSSVTFRDSPCDYKK